MTEHYDALETRSPAEREADLFARLPQVLAAALQTLGYAAHLKGVDTTGRDLARRRSPRLPVLRKADLPALQKAAPALRWPRPCRALLLLAGSSPRPARSSSRKAPPPSAWNAARGCYAAGFRRAISSSTRFSYHLTPGGFIMDLGRPRASAARSSRPGPAIPSSRWR